MKDINTASCGLDSRHPMDYNKEPNCASTQILVPICGEVQVTDVVQCQNRLCFFILA